MEFKTYRGDAEDRSFDQTLLKFEMNSNTIQFLTSAALMSSVIFIPNLAEEFNASYVEIGIIVAAYNLAFFISSYLFGRASDIYGRMVFLQAGLIISAILFLLQIFANDLTSLLIVRALAGFGAGIFPPALIAHVYDSKRSLGKFSAYGSLGWALGSLVAGFIAVYSSIFIISSLMFAISLFLSLNIQHAPKRHLKVPFFPTKIIKKNFKIYFSFFLRHLGAVSVWAVFPLYLVYLGADKFWIGILYAVNSISQFFVMQKIDKFDSELLIRVGLILSIAVFFLYALATDYYQVIPVQVLLAISWSCLYVGSLTSLMKRNIETATSAGILNSVISISGVFGPIIAGITSEFLGLKFLMYLASILSLIGLFINRLINTDSE